MSARNVSAVATGIALAARPHAIARTTAQAIASTAAGPSAPAAPVLLIVAAVLITSLIVALIVAACLRIRRAERRMRDHGSPLADLATAPGVTFGGLPASAEPERRERVSSRGGPR